MKCIDNIQRSFFPFFALATLIFLLYSNAFTTPFVFDDNPNIIDNPPLHITNLMPETLWHTFFAFPFQEGKIYRPIPCLSIALNWFIGGTNTIGYHIFNIFIHYGVALFLYLTILHLFSTPALRDRYPVESRYFIALFSAVLWAVSPIQTQAITYIIQRMASMATLFSLLAIYFYIKERVLEKSLCRVFVPCFIFYLLALGSKENAVLLPVSLLLIEYTFFFRNDNNYRKIFLKILAGLTLIIIFAGILYLIRQGTFTNFFNVPGSRPFTYYERLLTESRVIFFYLSLIFYPLPSRLSIDHDFALSTSLLTPWTTIPAILTILVLILFAFKYSRKWPLLSFAILFFFLNHIVESTVIPLELIFEHRNYLPSLFLFVPLVAGFYSLLVHYSQINRVVYSSLIVFVSLLIIFIGIGTYIRNSAYSSSEQLWTDTLQKNPHSARAFSNLGIIEGWRKNMTLQSLQRAVALNLGASQNVLYMTSFKPAILSNVGGIFYNYGLFDQAIDYLKQSVMLNPDYIDGRVNLAKSYMMKGEFSQALKHINYVIEKDTPHSRYFDIQGLIFLWLGKPELALDVFHSALSLLKNKKFIYYDLGAALSLSGHYKQARWFMGLAKQEELSNLRIALSLLENSIRARDEILIKKDANYLFDNFKMTSIAKALELLPTEYSSVPVNVELIRPVIEETAKNLSLSLFLK
jgi:protein O-mannosyl-transferase